MDNKWFNKDGNLKITSEELYCIMIYPWNKDGDYVIKKEISDFIKMNYKSYRANSDIIAIYYAMEFARETKNNYSACTLLCRNGITDNADWDSLEIRYYKE